MMESARELDFGDALQALCCSERRASLEGPPACLGGAAHCHSQCAAADCGATVSGGPGGVATPGCQDAIGSLPSTAPQSSGEGGLCPGSGDEAAARSKFVPPAPPRAMRGRANSEDRRRRGPRRGGARPRASD